MNILYLSCLLLLLLLFCSCIHASVIGKDLLSRIEHYEVVHLTTEHPKLLQILSYSKDTIEDNEQSTIRIHPYSSAFEFTSHGRSFKSYLTKNTGLFSSKYTEERHVYEGGKKQNIASIKTLDDIEQCYYNGDLESNEDGSVVMHACTGDGHFTGYIHINNDDKYMVEPAFLHLDNDELSTHIVNLQSIHGVHTVSNQSTHIVYKLSSYKHPTSVSCGVDEHTDEYEHINQLLQDMEQHSHNEHNDDNNIDILSKSKIFQTQVASNLNVELLIVNDNRRYVQVGDTVEQSAAVIVSYVNDIYVRSAFNPTIEVVLVSQITFINEDPWEADVIPGDMTQCPDCTNGGTEVSVALLLNTFHSWRTTDGATPAHDNAHLLSGHDFQTVVVGYAGVNTMCQSTDSGGIDQTSTHIELFSGAIVAHEMGHNFGFLHDSSGNTCQQSGFIMNAVITDPINPPTDFSSCSHDYFQASFLPLNRVCLDDPVTSTWGNPVCGNGFIESNGTVTEECDCGNSISCVGTNDECCDATTCRLLPSATCTDSEPCCIGCQPAPRNTPCREATSSCDIEEVCDGIESSCPVDIFKGAGRACDDGYLRPGLCFSGTCSSYTSACRAIGASSSGGPYEECPFSIRDANIADPYCGTLLCNDIFTSQCYPFSGDQVFDYVQVPNGVPCSTDFTKQCYDGACIDSELINPSMFWQHGSWPVCSDCSETQYRDVLCKNINIFGILTTVPDDRCSPVNRPSGSQLCINQELNCVHSIHDNDLDLYARSLATEYDYLDKAATLRSMVPRVCGPDTLTLGNGMIEYLTCTFMLAIPGVFMFAISFFFFCSYLLCWNCVWNKCCNKFKKEGYTYSERCWPFVFICIFGSLCMGFASMGMFFNGEIRRSITDENTGIQVSIDNFLFSSWQLTQLIGVPLSYFSASSTITLLDDAVLSFDRIIGPVTTGTTELLNELDGFVRNAGLSSVYTQGRGDNHYTASDMIIACADCSMTSDGATASNEIHASTDAAFLQMQDTVDVARLTLADLRTLIGPNSQMSVIRNSTVTLSDFVYNARLDADSYLDTLAQLDAMRHPATLTFFSIPVFSFGLVVIAKLLSKSSLFWINFQVLFFMLMLSWLFFGFHLPLALIFGDTCDFLMIVENDLSTLGLPQQASTMITACMTGQNLITALNLTQEMNFESTVSFPPVPDFNSLFNLTALDELNIRVNNITSASYGFTTNYTSALVSLNLLTSPCDATVYTINNVESCDPVLSCSGACNVVGCNTTVDAIRAAKWNLLTAIDSLANVELEITSLKTNMSNVMQTKALLELTAQGIAEDLEITGTSLGTLLTTGSSFRNLSNCDLGESYVSFKVAFCDTLSTAISYSTLALFGMGILLFPLIVLSFQESQRVENEKGQLNDAAEKIQAAWRVRAMKKRNGGKYIQQGGPDTVVIHRGEQKTSGGKKKVRVVRKVRAVNLPGQPN